jgi:hypothetical protein
MVLHFFVVYAICSLAVHKLNNQLFPFIAENTKLLASKFDIEQELSGQTKAPTPILCLLIES